MQQVAESGALPPSRGRFLRVYLDCATEGMVSTRSLFNLRLKKENDFFFARTPLQMRFCEPFLAVR